MAKKRSSLRKTTRRKKRVTKKQAPARTVAKKKAKENFEEEVKPKAPPKAASKSEMEAALEVEELTFGELGAEVKPSPGKAKEELAEEAVEKPLVKLPQVRKIEPKEKQFTVPKRLVFIPWVLLLITVLMIGLMVRGAIYQAKKEEIEEKKMSTSQGLVEEIEAGNLAPIARLEVIGDELNFRSAPQVNPSTLIGKFKKGTILFVLSQGKGWYSVAVAAGKDGYVKGYITTDPAYTKKVEMKSK